MYQPIIRIFDGKTFYQIPGFVDYWISADDEVISDKGRTHYPHVKAHRWKALRPHSGAIAAGGRQRQGRFLP